MFKKNSSYILLDIVLINISIAAAYFLRFGRNMDMDYFNVYLVMAPFITLGKIAVFYYFGLYKRLWKYAGVDELVAIFMSVAVSNGFIIIAIYFLRLAVPRSIYVIATFIDIFIFGLSRFGTRIFQGVASRDILDRLYGRKGKKIMVIGAGEAGCLLMQEMKNYPKLDMYPVCAIDDDTAKHGRKVSGVPIVGGRDKIGQYAKSMGIEEIIIAIPSITNSQLKDIVEECEKTACAIKIVPFLSELRSVDKSIGDVLLQRIRNVDINDLLGRDEVRIDTGSISNYIKGKRVLVTGGGGSIGSELCRQIRKFEPEKLIILDISEANLFDILEEFKREYSDVSVEGIIASVRDREQIREIFDSHKPQIVFHAAAHKHVHFMEKYPQEAVKNNVFGTLNVVEESDRIGVERFILISTDKAVNPANVMGATKRICEMMVQAYSKASSTIYAAVRFGNVLGSSGSVIPLFKKQIEKGGPVTVTDPNVVRYFMTIPEAAQLVVQAGALARGGEIFILDMGEPVKIDKLARDLIKLSGFEPDVDIKIVYTGLREGEKMYEELVMCEEDLEETQHDKILVASPMDVDADVLKEKLAELGSNICSYSFKELKLFLSEIVPTYRNFKNY